MNIWTFEHVFSGWKFYNYQNAFQERKDGGAGGGEADEGLSDSSPTSRKYGTEGLYLIARVSLTEILLSGRFVYICMHTEKSYWNLVKSARNQIVFTIFRLIWIQTEVRLDPNQSGNGKYNLISGWFNKISKRFLCVYDEWC